VANEYQKAQQFAATALGLLEREIVLPALTWRDFGREFVGAAGDTVSIRVPARTTSRSRTLRGTRTAASEGTGIIQMDELTEQKIDVTLDEAIYSAVPTTDEEERLDIRSYAEQILTPQVRAVAEGLENKLAAEMIGATYATTLTLDTVDPFNTAVDARIAMNKQNVPLNDRIIVIGADMEAPFLKSEHLNRVDASGTDSALRDAIIGRLAGFNTIVVSNALPANVGFAFHRTAYVLSLIAPRVPDGASFGAAQAFNGMGMRWLKDYDFRNAQDRSMVDTYAGTNIVSDGPAANEVQTVTMGGTVTGGDFTLTFQGQTTAAIAYNATAAAVQAALEGLAVAEPGDFTVTGGPLPGTAVTVEFQGRFAGKNVEQMTATNNLTGTSPTVTVGTTTEGGTGGNTFIRAIKLVMP
jgi:hypothetical protein